MIQFMVATFAVYRISRMLAIEDGAFDLFIKWRGLVAEQTGIDSWITRGFACPLCLSFWVALFLSPFVPFNNSIDLVFNWLALSGAASFLYKLEHD